jgi:hypothetical protein
MRPTSTTVTILLRQDQLHLLDQLKHLIPQMQEVGDDSDAQRGTVKVLSVHASLVSPEAETFLTEHNIEHQSEDVLSPDENTR